MAIRPDFRGLKIVNIQYLWSTTRYLSCGFFIFKEVTMRGLLLGLVMRFPMQWVLLGWDDKKAISPPIGLKPYTGFRDKREHGY